jgi:hypothetical protein
VRKRVTSAGKAVVYAVIATSALKVALGEGSRGSEKSTDTMTAKLMDLPAGQVLVGLVGAGIIAVGVALAFIEGTGQGGCRDAAKFGNSYRFTN